MDNAADLSTFTRIIINNKSYVYNNGELILKTINKKVGFLLPVNKSISLSKNFISMELETRNINGILELYTVGIYDGETSISFYLNDYKNTDEMLEESIKYLMKRKYDNYKIYLHNFSYFNGIFLLKILSNLSNNIRPIIRDGRLIDIRFNFNNNYNIYFRYSLLLLPSYLKKLANNFNVENKGIFPYNFVNSNNLYYTGNILDFKYFYNISLDEYNLYCKSFIYKGKLWNLREESIKYCIKNCIIYYKILDNF